MTFLSKRTLCVSAVAALSAVACKFAGVTTFRIDVPNNTTVWDVTSDPDGRLVVSRNDGLWLYRDGRFEAQIPMDRDRNFRTTELADSTLENRFWAYQPYNRNPNDDALVRYHVPAGTGHVVTDNASVDLDAWDKINDVAVGDNERIYVVGIHGEEGPAIGTCRMNGATCGRMTLQTRRTDSGEFMSEPIAIAVDRSTDKVFVAESKGVYASRLMEYTASLGLTNKPATEVTYTMSMAADGGLLAVYHALIGENKRADSLQLFGTSGTTFFDSDSLEDPHANQFITGYSTSAKCGKLWSVYMDGGDLVMDRHQVCNPD